MDGKSLPDESRFFHHTVKSVCKAAEQNFFQISFPEFSESSFVQVGVLNFRGFHLRMARKDTTCSGLTDERGEAQF